MLAAHRRGTRVARCVRAMASYPSYEIWFARERPKILGTSPAEGDLTGDGDVAAHGAATHRRDERDGDGETGARAVLGNRPGRHVHVGFHRAVQAAEHAPARGTPGGHGDRRARRLFHDVAEVT